MTATDTQDRLEIILKELFDSAIHIEASYKRPAVGLKCRYDGGVIDDQIVKAVKFKIEISEKSSGFLMTPGAHAMTMSGTGASNANANNNPISSSAVAAILATVEQHSQKHSIFSHNHPSSGSSTASSSPFDAQGRARSASTRSSSSAGRRASDGGSILSSAAAAVTSSLAARMHLSTHHHSPAFHPTASEKTAMAACPPLPNGACNNGLRRAVKVTLHQQQGANSTLRMIHERLCVAWDQYHQQQQLQASAMSLMAAMPGRGGVTNGVKASRIAAV